MKLDMNTLAEHFAHTAFRVELVHRFVREPGMYYSSQSDPCPGFVFPLSGKAEFVFDGTPYLLAPGNVVHGGANLQLSRRVVGKENWEYLLVLYSICGSEPKDFSLLSSHFELQTGQSPRLMELLERLWQISSRPGGIYAFRTEMLFRCVLDELFRSVHRSNSNETQVLFDQIIAYIHENYMDPLSVGALAKHYQVNENRLSYLFQKYSGMGPGNYLIAYRLNRAKELLLNFSLTVSVVAKSVGYTDPYHFSRAFKKQFGISPSEFRNKFKNNTW
ncbi:AraC family transcriptional regulator [Clostridium minihomine]|uniref:AraC family transcriptional regulator n=1 Tax=Clostridium minihomine TaxID=2045012 RepID=UPI0013EDD2E3|nr:AraC family transcriptional regulator [Clostridium minihomine]